MKRTTLALLVAPALIPLGMEVYFSRGQSFGSSWIISAIYGFFGYIVSFAFGSSIIEFLRSRRWTKLWHFTLAGILLALGVGIFFVVEGFASRLVAGESFGAIKVSEQYFFSALLPIGASVGATVWLIAERSRLDP
jgi:hypothetical protein